jgi:mono/diheme cytochrome c family protein
MTIDGDLQRRAQRGTPRGPDEVWHAAVDAARRRKRMPLWVVPVLVALPLWAVIYLGGLSPASDGAPSQLETGAQVFSNRCSACHGTAGQGAAGRPMTDGAVLDTFPDILGQLQFVWTGSDGVGSAGSPYGDPARAGGQHVTLGYGGGAKMPPFRASLTQAQLLAVVRYEREVLSGAVVDPTQLDARGDLLWPDGSPMLDGSDNLVAPDGRPLFDDAGRLTIEPDWTAPVGGTG